MKYSYSSVSTYEQCPYRWKLKYIDKIPEEQNDNFIIGSAMHKGIETGSVDCAIKYLKDNVCAYNDFWVNEEIKITQLLPKVLTSINKFSKCEHEVKIEDDNFIGFGDMIADGDLYDFKYSNSPNYLDGKQLNLYKHFLGRDIDKMYYVWIPKIRIRQKKTETVQQFRRRLIEKCEETQIRKISVEEDKNAILWYNEVADKIEADSDYLATPNNLCDWCCFKNNCSKFQEEKGVKMEQVEEKTQSTNREGVKNSLLPKPERKSSDGVKFVRMWIYGAPFSGKTTFANSAKMPLILNTDGNAKWVDAQSILINDHDEQQGRMVIHKYGWQTFKDIVAELQVNNGGFDTIIVDLVDAMYEMCRTYICKKKNWDHESDDSFRAYDMVRKAFFDTIERLMHIDMNVILISHEDASRDYTSKRGETMTTFSPNMQAKVCMRLSGMVDVVARVIAEDDGHYLTFKSSETVFGGGRIKLSQDKMKIDKKTGFEDFSNLIKEGE